MDVSNKDAFSFCATLANIFGNAKIEANNPETGGNPTAHRSVRELVTRVE